MNFKLIKTKWTQFYSSWLLLISLFVKSLFPITFIFWRLLIHDFFDFVFKFTIRILQLVNIGFDIRQLSTLIFVLILQLSDRGSLIFICIFEQFNLCLFFFFFFLLFCQRFVQRFNLIHQVRLFVWLVIQFSLHNLFLDIDFVDINTNLWLLSLLRFEVNLNLINFLLTSINLIFVLTNQALELL